MKIEYRTNTNPGSTGPEATFPIEDDKLTQADADRLVDDLKAQVAAQSGSEVVPVDFTILVDGAVLHKESATLRHNDVGDVNSAMNISVNAALVRAQSA